MLLQNTGSQLPESSSEQRRFLWAAAVDEARGYPHAAAIRAIDQHAKRTLMAREPESARVGDLGPALSSMA